MAEAGFYLVGSQSEPDLVRCYYCRRELDGWEPQDIPWDEHKRRDCPYITLGKLPQNLTVEDAFQLEGERKCIIVVKIGLLYVFRLRTTESSLIKPIVFCGLVCNLKQCYLSLATSWLS
jgi:hypothetical protein